MSFWNVTQMDFKKLTAMGKPVIINRVNIEYTWTTVYLFGNKKPGSMYPFVWLCCISTPAIIDSSIWKILNSVMSVVCRGFRSDLLLLKYFAEISPRLDFIEQINYGFYIKPKRSIRARGRLLLNTPRQSECLFHLYWVPACAHCSQNHLIYLSSFALGYMSMLVWFGFRSQGWNHMLRMT